MTVMETLGTLLLAKVLLAGVLPLAALQLCYMARREEAPQSSHPQCLFTWPCRVIQIVERDASDYINGSLFEKHDLPEIGKSANSVSIFMQICTYIHISKGA
jgi:hypothetical protein